MSGEPPRIWVLLGSRIGDNNQLLALAEALKLPFETRTLGYRSSWPLWLHLFPDKPLLLDADSRKHLAPPWPDLVIGIGRRSVAVARWIRAQSGGRTRIVRLGNPRADADEFDLVVTTRQYPVEAADNVLLLPVAMSRHRAIRATEEESRWLAALPRPHVLMSLGGTTRYWRLPIDELLEASRRLVQRAEQAGGTLIVVSSPRTARYALDALEAQILPHPHAHLIADGRIRFGVLLADADEHFVTGDSVSMLSEAVLTGKPVGLIPVQLDEEGARKLGRAGFSSSTRDIRRFWADLRSRGLVGTIDDPQAGTVEDPVELAAGAVLRLLGDRVE